VFTSSFGTRLAEKERKNITVKHKMYIPFTMILIYNIIRLNTLQLAFKGNYPTIIYVWNHFLLPTLLKTCLLHQEKQVWWLIALHSAPLSLA